MNIICSCISLLNLLVLSQAAARFEEVFGLVKPKKIDQKHCDSSRKPPRKPRNETTKPRNLQVMVLSEISGVLLEIGGVFHAILLPGCTGKAFA